MNPVGKRGTVTIAIKGREVPGEVEVRTDGGVMTYIAYCDRGIPRHAPVVVYEDRGGRRVDVEPLNPT